MAFREENFGAESPRDKDFNEREKKSKFYLQKEKELKQEKEIATNFLPRAGRKLSLITPQRLKITSNLLLLYANGKGYCVSSVRCIWKSGKERIQYFQYFGWGFLIFYFILF